MAHDRLTLHVFEDAGALVRSALATLQKCASESVGERGRFTVALAGGNTPRALYQAWAELPGLPWDRTELCFGDERCVPPDHADSNARMVHEALTHQPFVPEDHVHRVRAELPPAAAARDYEVTLRGLFPSSPDFPNFDLVLLGLGADGHTASLFPHTPALQETRAWVRENNPPAQATPRVTLTYPVINAARNVLFLVVGADKREALQRLLSATGSIADTPARGIAPSAGECIVLADRAAASF